MKQPIFFTVGIVLCVALFCLLPSHSLAQSHRYIFLPYIFPPSAMAPTTTTGVTSYRQFVTTHSSVFAVGTPSVPIFTVFDPPDASFTDSLSINANGEVTGYFQQGLNNIRGFVRHQSGSLAVFDAPNSSFTVGTSINDGGDVSGYFIDTSQSNKERGFVRDRNGIIAVFDAPNALTTAPASINAGGNVTGVFLDASQSNKGRGFVRNRNGTIVVFDVPNGSYTSPSSINAGGNVTGFFNDVNPSLSSHGFVRDQAGNISVFDPPTSVSTGGFGINGAGDVTGYFQYGSQGNVRGFVRHQGGALIVFDAPNSSFTYAFSINDGGDVTGMFTDASQSNRLRGFVRDQVGNIAVFDPNTAGLTVTRAINVNGTVTGSFQDNSQGKTRGFVRSRDTVPPMTTATPSPRPNANGWNNTNVLIALSATDPAGPGVNQILFAFDGAQSASWQTVAGNAASAMISTEGTTILSYFATDNAGNQETAKTLSVRIDKTPPVISGLPAGGCRIWPPNHKLVPVATITAADALSGLAPGSFKVTGTSNDPANGQIVITGGPGQFLVQLGADKGQVYTLTATARDLVGNAITKQATCTVPHDQAK